nr:MAG TPA: hypothetical protein [Caudoviricetes sp.]
MFGRKKKKIAPPANDISKEIHDIIVANLNGLPTAETARNNGASNLYEKTKEDISDLAQRIKDRIICAIENGKFECSKYITSDDYLVAIWKEMPNYLKVIQDVLGELGYKTEVKYNEGHWFSSYDLTISWKETNKNE